MNGADEQPKLNGSTWPNLNGSTALDHSWASHIVKASSLYMPLLYEFLVHFFLGAGCSSLRKLSVHGVGRVRLI